MYAIADCRLISSMARDLSRYISQQENARKKCLPRASCQRLAGIAWMTYGFPDSRANSMQCYWASFYKRRSVRTMCRSFQPVAWTGSHVCYWNQRHKSTPIFYSAFLHVLRKRGTQKIPCHDFCTISAPVSTRYFTGRKKDLSVYPGLYRPPVALHHQSVVVHHQYDGFPPQFVVLPCQSVAFPA